MTTAETTTDCRIYQQIVERLHDTSTGGDSIRYLAATWCADGDPSPNEDGKEAHRVARGSVFEGEAALAYAVIGSVRREFSTTKVTVTRSCTARALSL